MHKHVWLIRFSSADIDGRLKMETCALCTAVRLTRYTTIRPYVWEERGGHQYAKARTTRRVVRFAPSATQSPTAAETG